MPELTDPGPHPATVRVPWELWVAGGFALGAALLTTLGAPLFYFLMFPMLIAGVAGVVFSAVAMRLRPWAFKACALVLLLMSGMSLAVTLVWYFGSMHVGAGAPISG